MEEARKIEYRRHEFHHPPKSCKGTLLTLIYDIPYFPPCGIFPPLHILNEVLAGGGGGGGMGPGASWKPFSISAEEYQQLITAIKTTPIETIQPYARYAWLRPQFDDSFDGLTDYISWMRAVCEKHRETWHAKLRATGKMT